MAGGTFAQSSALGVGELGTDENSLAAFLMMVEDDLEEKLADQDQPVPADKGTADNLLPGPVEPVDTASKSEERRRENEERRIAFERLMRGPEGVDSTVPLPGNAETLALADVIASVYRAYPEIVQARLLLPLGNCYLPMERTTGNSKQSRFPNQLASTKTTAIALVSRGSSGGVAMFPPGIESGGVVTNLGTWNGRRKTQGNSK